MKYEDMKVGHYYMTHHNIPYMRVYGGLMSKPLLNIGTNEVVEAISVDWIECDREGNPIAPEPAVGQVWRFKNMNLALNTIVYPDGQKVCCGVDGLGKRWLMRDSFDLVVDGLTYVGEVGKNG